MKTNKEHESRREEFNRLCEKDFEVAKLVLKKFSYLGNVKTSAIRDLLDCENVSKRKGVFTVRKGFFYTHGKSEEDLVELVKEKIPSAEIIDEGTKYFAFKGGAPVAKQSHWYVTFTV